MLKMSLTYLNHNFPLPSFAHYIKLIVQMIQHIHKNPSVSRKYHLGFHFGMYATSVTHFRTFNREKHENVYADDGFNVEFEYPGAQTPNKFSQYNNYYYYPVEKIFRVHDLQSN